MTTTQIWETYSEDIKRFILSKTKDETVANDILQDTFIKVHTKLHTLKDGNKLKSWLFSVARYTLMDYLKTSKVKIEFNDFDTEDVPETHEHTEKDCLRGILVNLPKKIQRTYLFGRYNGLKTKKGCKKIKFTVTHRKIANTTWTTKNCRRLYGLLWLRNE